MPLDARERLVRVVVSLLDEPQLLSLALVESTLHTTHKARVGEGRAESREERRGEERRRKGDGEREKKGRWREGEGMGEDRRGQG